MIQQRDCPESIIKKNWDIIGTGWMSIDIVVLWIVLRVKATWMRIIVMNQP